MHYTPARKGQSEVNRNGRKALPNAFEHHGRLNAVAPADHALTPAAGSGDGVQPVALGGRMFSGRVRVVGWLRARLLDAGGEPWAFTPVRAALPSFHHQHHRC